MSKDVILKPRISEKGYALSEKLNTYIFDVPTSANKHSIARAVASQYEVTVKDVRIASIPGKTIRSVKRRSRVQNAKRSDLRKAYVTLKAGDKLPIYAASEQEAPAKKESK